MKITIEQIIKMGPCPGYDTEGKIIERMGDVWPLTPLEIAVLDIPVDDRFWMLLHPRIMPEKQMHLLACDFAEHRLSAYEAQYLNDDRSRKVIKIKRSWVAGLATDEELSVARVAVDRARGVGWTVDSSAPSVADRNAALAAVSAAVWATSVGSAVCAVRSAAMAAARSAMEAAGPATKYADRDTAWDTEKQWQLGRVIEVLKGIDNENNEL